MTTRYLQKIDDGFLYVYSDTLAKRPDMRVVDPAEVPQLLQQMLPPAARVALPVAPAAPTLAVEAASPQAQIEAFTDKEALEAYGRTHGIELDRRKSLANMKAELLNRLAG
jgi:hypothetical protein